MKDLEAQSSKQVSQTHHTQCPQNAIIKLYEQSVNRWGEKGVFSRNLLGCHANHRPFPSFSVSPLTSPSVVQTPVARPSFVLDRHKWRKELGKAHTYITSRVVPRFSHDGMSQDRSTTTLPLLAPLLQPHRPLIYFTSQCTTITRGCRSCTHGIGVFFAKRDQVY